MENQSYPGLKKAPRNLNETLTIHIKNQSDLSHEVCLFGALKEYPQNPAIEILLAESDYSMLRKWLLSNAMKVFGVKVFSDRKEQLQSWVKIIRRSVFGDSDTANVYPYSWRSSDESDNKLINMANLSMLVTCETEWIFPILPNTKVTFVFSIENRTAYDNSLLNKEQEPVNLKWLRKRLK